jgi:uncharacterized protein (DUF302 family)
MSYHISKTLGVTFDQAVSRVIEGLKDEGFGVLTEINVRETLKNKLDVDFRNYRILGACNPSFAYRALQSEDKIGTMLPCNVVVQEHDSGSVEVSAVDPMASMQAIENQDLGEIAEQVRAKLSLEGKSEQKNMESQVAYGVRIFRHRRVGGSVLFPVVG